MGMDVFGRNPSAEQGRYFRASVWTWRPIHELICTTCSDLLDDELVEAMAFNDGKGPNEEETCLEMAGRFNRWLAENREGFEMPSPTLQVTDTGRLVSAEELTANPDLVTRTPYQVRSETLKAWTSFLRHCGGFEVW